MKSLSEFPLAAAAAALAHLPPSHVPGERPRQLQMNIYELQMNVFTRKLNWICCSLKWAPLFAASKSILSAADSLG